MGRALYTSLFAVLAAQGYVNLYAGVTLPNPASVALHTRLGYRPVGIYEQVGFKFGRWHDVGWWQRELGHRTTAPSEPRPLPAMREQPQWDEWLSSGGPGVPDGR